MTKLIDSGVVIVTVLYAMTMLVSFLGNSILIHIVWKVPEARSLTSFMFVNMAVADLLVTVSMMPVSVNEIHNDFHWAIPGTFGDVTCRTIQYITKITVMASILSLTLIAIDRFYVVKFPLESTSHTTWYRKSKYISPILWILSSALMSIMPVFYFFNVEDSLCELSPLGDATATMRGLFIYLFLVTYLVPLAVISTLYGITAHAIWHRRAPTIKLTDIQQRQDTITKKRAIRTLIVITVAFFLCWLPVQLMHIFRAVTVFRVPLPIPSIVLYLGIWLAHANSALNPWLYIFLSSKVKLAFFQLLGRRARRRKETLKFKPQNLARPIRLELIDQISSV